jgi:hypothetical protein
MRGVSAYLGDVESPEERCGDLKPLVFERAARRRLARPMVPILGVGRIAFFSVQVGMHPRAGWALVLLCRLMSFRPVTLGVPPQSGERDAQLLGWSLAQ